VPTRFYIAAHGCRARPRFQASAKASTPPSPSVFGRLRKVGAMVQQWPWLKRNLVGGLLIWLVTALVPVTFVAITAFVSAANRLLHGEWAYGFKTAGLAIPLAFLAILLAYLAYRAFPPPAPWTPSPAKSISTGNRGSGYFKKCAACAKFTRHTKVCRHCGCDLT
jgi:hypothetical protein